MKSSASSVLILLLAAAVMFPQKSLIFDDEFNGSELDLTRWSPRDPFDASHGLAGIDISGGQLHLHGTISTFGLFSQTFGHFEIRCRGAKARFRLLPEHLVPLPSIDIFETGANGPSRIFFGNHWGTEQTERSYGDWFDAPDLSAAFHTIAADWDREEIVWSIDGKEKFRSVDGIPQQPMFLEISSPAQGAAFDIDYIRVDPIGEIGERHARPPV